MSTEWEPIRSESDKSLMKRAEVERELLVKELEVIQQKITAVDKRYLKLKQKGTPVFHKAISVAGGYNTTFVFQNAEEIEKFKATTLEQLQAKYGELAVGKPRKLDGLKVGDKCHVAGEGQDVFTITGVCFWEDYRWGFTLDSGFCESVYKCRKVGGTY